MEIQIQWDESKFDKLISLKSKIQMLASLYQNDMMIDDEWYKTYLYESLDTIEWIKQELEKTRSDISNKLKELNSISIWDTVTIKIWNYDPEECKIIDITNTYVEIQLITSWIYMKRSKTEFIIN